MNYFTEVPMYHNGTFVKNEVGKICAFVSEQTGERYPINRIEPEDQVMVAELYFEDSDFRDSLYIEDITIVHEVSGDVRFDRDGTADEIVNQELDGKPVSQYPLTADFELAIDDTIAQEYMNDY